jgi:hypothetical protein
MDSIYYERSDGEVYQIDEVSQQILVCLFLHGEAEPKRLVDTVGAEDKHQVHSRVESQLGSGAAGFVDTATTHQTTLTDGPDKMIELFVLTDTGEAFVKKHRGGLSMPVDIAELAKRVTKLQLDDHLIEDLRHRIETLEARVNELEE